MIMDWREMAGRPTVRMNDFWTNYRWAWSGGKKVGYGYDQIHWNGQIDPIRGWIICLCWLIACSADIYYLYMIIRRPRLILDFALTLVFNHLVLTTYYSASIPTSIFFYIILFGAQPLPSLWQSNSASNGKCEKALKLTLSVQKRKMGSLMIWSWGICDEINLTVT
ncbi:hypothetical protein FA13DRAFT_1864541, partial [Coprinellus micaceus]